MNGNGVSYRRQEMKTTVTTKMLKHAPVIGCMASWQRDSRLLGIVG